jgi:hypothetical protein
MDNLLVDGSNGYGVICIIRYELESTKMKPIKISVENFPAIETALKAVNGKASAHTFTTGGSVHIIADLAEAKLDRLGLPKSCRAGAVFIAQSGESLPASYKYKAQTTNIRIERKASGWVLTDISPSTLYPKSKPQRALVLTEAQDAKAIEVLRRAYMTKGA